MRERIAWDWMAFRRPDRRRQRQHAASRARREAVGSGVGMSFELGLEAMRRESVNDNADPEHGVGFRIRATCY